METTFKIFKTETGKTDHKLGVQSLKINNKIMDNYIVIHFIIYTTVNTTITYTRFYSNMF
jgi:hypothetical protein